MPGRCAFPRLLRLTQRREFSEVFRHGEKAAGRGFLCRWVRRGDMGSKLGMAVSRKVGRAVVRNHVKRCVREFFRRRHPDFREDVWLVVVALPEAASMSCAECSEALEAILRRGKVLDG